MVSKMRLGEGMKDNGGLKCHIENENFMIKYINIKTEIKWNLICWF